MMNGETEYTFDNNIFSIHKHMNTMICNNANKMYESQFFVCLSR